MGRRYSLWLCVVCVCVDAHVARIRRFAKAREQKLSHDLVVESPRRRDALRPHVCAHAHVVGPPPPVVPPLRWRRRCLCVEAPCPPSASAAAGIARRLLRLVPSSFGTNIDALLDEAGAHATRTARRLILPGHGSTRLCAPVVLTLTAHRSRPMQAARASSAVRGAWQRVLTPSGRVPRGVLPSGRQSPLGRPYEAKTTRLMTSPGVLHASEMRGSGLRRSRAVAVPASLETAQRAGALPTRSRRVTLHDESNPEVKPSALEVVVCLPPSRETSQHASLPRLLTPARCVQPMHRL